MSSNQRNYIITWFNLVAYLSTLIVNYLANALPLFGKDTRELSDQYPVLITPESYVFSIWSVIYTLLAGFVILTLLPSGRKQIGEVKKISAWFIISSALNITWLFFWHGELVFFSVLTMIALLISIIKLYHLTHQNTKNATRIVKIFTQLPFSLYLGWISVATIVNISTWLYDIEWNGWGISDTGWTITMLIIATALAVLISRKYNDIAVVLVFIWAFIGIAIKQSDYTSIMVVAYVLSGLLFVYSLYLFRKRST
ncbi:tryptophan-rich sensory protein [Longirhabdus pacifica]|uniref:tryptophan-rich sensory protein n=1 Tax=Longirhabdus pacifica TaxID=2305227 RepID=UPI001008A333|nr:tryptophan-rich sensory protein [Longirhabdus pacifica]